MKLTILGSSGSLAQPGNPASGYLLEGADGTGIIMDLGPGTLANLQKVRNPADAHIMFSHLHADHCLDFPSLMVWRRFHPTTPAACCHTLLGPAASVTHLGRLSSDDQPEGVDDMSDTFAVGAWQSERVHAIGPFDITPYPTVHPVEAYALRVTDRATGATMTYSGDSAYTDKLIDAARDADIFFCEANWGASSSDKAPGMHLSGEEAGRIARLAGVKRLVIVHVPPWIPVEESVDAARAEFDGPVEFGYPLNTYSV